MPTTIDTIISLINANVDNYPNKAFQNNTLRTILLLMTGQLPGGGGSGVASGATYKFTGADFSTSTNLPIPTLSGLNLAVFFNDIQRYLTKGTEWTDLSGGGITITIPGFDATTTNLNSVFYVSIQAN
jgi:hypothetical protein